MTAIRGLKKGVTKVRRKAGWAKKELVDKRILAMASSRYDKVKSQIKKRRAKIDAEAEVVLDLGEKILERAKRIRAGLKKDSLRTTKKKRRKKVASSVVAKASKKKKTKKKARRTATKK